MDLQGKVVVVTGASSGIGREIALQLGRRKACVALLARRKDRLEATAQQIVSGGGKAFVVVADIGIETAVQEAIQQVAEHFGRIDVLINNAGSGLLATVEETTPEQMERVMRTNFWGTYYGIRSVLPLMNKQGSGQIITIASMSGRRGAPLKAAYCASKFAQIGLVESLRMELRGTGILCTLIFPGATETEFLEAMANPSGREAKYYGAMQKPQEVAEAVIQSIGRSKPEIITQKHGRIQVILNAAAPALADWLVSRRKKDIVSK